MIRPGITDETLEKAGIHFTDYPELGSLEIPYLDIYGRPTGFSRWRLRHTKPDGQKYYQKPRTGIHVYFIPGGLRTNPRLIICEGEFKVLSLYEFGYQAIGLTGLYTYKRNGDGIAELLPEIKKAITLVMPSEILFLGDSDTATNLDFSRSAHFLASNLNIPVRLPRLPLNGPKGIDDLKEACNGSFPLEFEKMIAEAVNVSPKISFVALAEILLGLAAKQFPLLGPVEFQVQVGRLIKLVGNAKLSGESAVAIERLEALAAKLSGSTKAKFRSAVNDFLSQSDTSPKTGPNPDLVKAYGTPAVFAGGDSEITQINDPFWAGHYVSQKTRIIHERKEKEFYSYNPAIGIYVPVSPDLIRTELADMMLECSRKWTDYRDLEHFRNQKELNGAIVRLRGIVEQEDFFRSDDYIVHLGNCTLKFHLETAEFTKEDFSPDHRSRNRSPIDYVKGADCLEFKERILGHVSEADQKLLQKYAGQCLVGRNIMQRLTILDGVGGASKSSFVLTIVEVVGERNIYELRTEMLGERFEIGRMIGRTLLVGADVPGDFLSRKGARRIKSLVGGDLLEAELKSSNARFTIYGVFNLIIASNARLHIRLEGDRSAWERRLCIARYDTPFTGQRIVDVHKYLIQKEAPGILNWCIEGLQELLKDYRATGDIILSAEQKERVNALLSESNSLRLFVRDNIIQTNGPGDSLTVDEIITEYVADCVQVKHWTPLLNTEAKKQLPNLMTEFFGLTESHSIQRSSPNQTSKNKITMRSERGYRNVRFIP